MDEYQQNIQAAEAWEALRLKKEKILRKYPLLGEPPMSYYGPRAMGGFGVRLAAACAFDALFLSYEPLDVRAVRGDRRRRTPLEIGIAREEQSRAVPLRSSAVLGHNQSRSLDIRDFHPRYHALGEQYHGCGLVFDAQEGNWSRF